MIETIGIISVILCRQKAIISGWMLFFITTDRMAVVTPKTKTTKSILIPSHL